MGLGRATRSVRILGVGKNAHLLVGALAHSGRWRGLLCESEDQPHQIDGLDRVARALGGLTLDWRFDRMATVVSPELFDEVLDFGPDGLAVLSQVAGDRGDRPTLAT